MFNLFPDWLYGCMAVWQAVWQAGGQAGRQNSTRHQQPSPLSSQTASALASQRISQSAHPPGHAPRPRPTRISPLPGIRPRREQISQSLIPRPAPATSASQLGQPTTSAPASVSSHHNAR